MAHLEDDRRRGTQGFATPRLSKVLRASLPGPEVWLPAAALLGLLATWEVGSRTGLVRELFFPAPSTIGGTVGRMFADGALTSALWATCGRLLQGLLVGGVPGMLLGLVAGWSRPVRRAIDPLVAAAHPIPKIAVYPLIMVIFGIGETSRVIIAATGAFFPLLINTMAGVRQINPIYFEVAENYGARAVKVLLRVVLPGALPSVLTGLLLASNVSLLLTIAVEMVSGQSGLGSLIWFAWETMRVEEIYAILVVITLLGVSFNVGLNVLARWLLPWQVERGV